MANLNFFMKVPIEQDGNLARRRLLRPRDLVELQAKMNVLAVLSNCPQTLNSVNGFNPTPRIIGGEPYMRSLASPMGH